MKDEELELAGRLSPDHVEQADQESPRPLSEQPTIHFTKLPEDTSGGRLAREWNYYRRQVGRLLAEGHESRWVLIKGEDIVGIWDTEEESSRASLQRFPMQDVLLQQIREREPILRCGAYYRKWPS